MMDPESFASYAPALALISLLAAIVNGALGYGFGSILVPFALLFLTNRVLNPVLVPVEVVLNGYVLWVSRDAVADVSRRVSPIAIGIVPGIVVGTLILAKANPAWLKFGTLLVLLPLILMQAAGFRRPIRSERSVGLSLGAAVGILYSVTTISGPPLATMLNNQGFTKQHFRAALALLRLVESTLTAVAYYFAGLYALTMLPLMSVVLLGIVVGVPTGAWLIQRVQPETFRRVCMAFDALLVAFGLSTLLRQLGLVETAAAYMVLVAVAAVDACLLYRYFTRLR